MSDVSRRAFLQGSAVVAAGAAFAGPFQGYVAWADGGRQSSGYGPLAPVPDLFDGTERLALPRGFSYRSFHHQGSVIEDGTVVPGRHDGMSTFKGSRGRSIIVRNHEINGPGTPLGDASKAYDPNTAGGTITFEVDGRGNARDAFVSCNGTQMNCAGGTTPWDSYLSCEETVNGDDVGPDFTGAPNTGLLKHGYLFEIPARGESDRVPIRAAGRFAHEAVVMDDDGSVVYETEDNFNFPSGFYRYLPPGRPRQDRRIRDGGTLQALKVKGADNADLSVGLPNGLELDVEWVTIDDPDPTFAVGTTNDQAISAVGEQGRAKGAAIFSRLEGIARDRGRIFFTSTQGGALAPGDDPPVGFGDGRGQVWSYHPGRESLTLVYESPGSSTLDLPDNIEMSSRGTIVLCEDGLGDNFVRGLTRKGEVFDFARNIDAAQVGQEFAGAAFSHDHRTLFVNIQSATGYSVAIWGPWDRGPF